jgi:parallel beta-helix repeat protein
MKKKLLLLAFVSVLLSTTVSLSVVGLLELRIVHASPSTSIGVATAYNMITNGSYPDLVILDVRTQSEYDGGHIHGTVWIPHTELEARIGELAGHENHEIIVYCLSGGRSATASEILDSHNFTKVYNMLGGISAWQSSGYPVWIATVHNVNTTFNYDTIQAAIDVPQTLDGHTILVDEGIYYENVVVDKTVSLIGENKTTTIIDGNGEESALLISRTQNVSVDSFTIRNSIFGVVLGDSSYTCFRNVDLVGSEYNFRFHGILWEHFFHDIDTSNTVNYKPIYYWVNKQDKEVPIDAGYVALINCSRIVMRNLNLEHNYDGITLFNVRNSRVENVSISNTLHGLYLRWNCTNNIIQRNFMTNNSAAIVLQRASSNNNVTGNIITNNNDGIGVDRSLSNSLSRNFIANNENGIWLFETRNNIISENDVVNNTWGIRIQDAYNNSIYHNNFINNEYQVYPLSGYTISTNLWDDGYPSGGNYWSDYFGLDLYGGPHQNETGSDGIGDTPYVIGENDRDNYPLMKPWSPAIIATIDLDPDTLNLKSKGRWINCYIELPEGYDVSDVDRATILLNNTLPVDPFWVDKPLESVMGDYDNDNVPDLMVKFNRAVVIEYLLNQNITYGNVTLTVTGEIYDGTLFEGSDMIMAKMPSKAIEKVPSEVDSDDEYVPVMPEFPSFIILPLFMITTLLAVIIYRRKHTT